MLGFVLSYIVSIRKANANCLPTEHKKGNVNCWPLGGQACNCQQELYMSIIVNKAGTT